MYKCGKTFGKRTLLSGKYYFVQHFFFLLILFEVEFSRNFRVLLMYELGELIVEVASPKCYTLHHHYIARCMA